MSLAAVDPALESLLAFWAEAGVDAAVEDAPVDKLRRREAERARASAAPVPAPSAVFAGPVRGDVAALLSEAGRLAAGADSLVALQAAAAALEAGAFRPPGARNTVFLRADDVTAVAVLGAAPGEPEAGAGEAFAGAEGRLLERMLAAAGLAGRAVRLHATLWPRPGGGDPSPEEAALARPFLDRALALARPRAALVLGDQPARLLLGRAEGALKLRGQALIYVPKDGGAPLSAVVTFAPGLLLRQPLAKKRAWEDLMTLADRVAGVGVAP